MRRARLTVSEAAAVDIIEQADWYKQRSDPELARRWEDALTSAVLRIMHHPRAGTISKFQHQNSAMSGEF